VADRREILMKIRLLIAATAFPAALALASASPAGALDIVSVPNVSEADLKASCERELGASFESGDDYYGCAHADGSTTSCERDGSGCTETTPTKWKPLRSTPSLSTLTVKLAPLSGVR
jgi:hypothetical protein